MLGPSVDCAHAVDGKALRLHPVQREHLPAFLVWMNDPGVTRNLMTTHGFCMENEVTWFEKMSPRDNRNHIVWAIMLGDELIGNAGIHGIEWERGVGTTGMLIGAKEYWGKGVATAVMRARAKYVFEQTRLAALYTVAFLRNEGSWKAATKAGYVQYGLNPRAAFHDGAWLDGWMGILTRERWEEVQRSK